MNGYINAPNPLIYLEQTKNNMVNFPVGDPTVKTYQNDELTRFSFEVVYQALTYHKEITIEPSLLSFWEKKLEMALAI